MAEKQLGPISGDSEGLTSCPAQSGPKLERVMGMMSRWWEGWSLARIAREHDVSRQRVGELLNWAGCTAALRHKTDRQHDDSPRHAPAQRVAEAHQLLTHPLAHRLTVRQRCALLWQARGLIYTDVARRMGTSAQAVRYFLVGARLRLERLSLREFAAQGPHAQPTFPDFDCSSLDELLSGPGAPPCATDAGATPGQPTQGIAPTAQRGANGAQPRGEEGR